ncbi:pilus assembly protein CpaC [Neorhodopirellula lusitana]|uniref:Pilus assembly protein CpaC n=2 Tax=Neorhodopirellula lusitana TaxID=445327 RepID=A0ABY1Q7C8_9BACT|nr:pilus assembly protein CpaC [Neorhodopirellula lusitana]
MVGPVLLMLRQLRRGAAQVFLQSNHGRCFMNPLSAIPLISPLGRVVVTLLVGWIAMPAPRSFAQDRGPVRLPETNLQVSGPEPRRSALANPRDERATPWQPIPDVGPSRIQSGLPAELILPPPSDAAKQRASRFVESEIDPEIPLSLVLGRPKILRLADTPARIYVPDEDTIRTEIIDQESGRELAVTGIRPGTTTLMLWFQDSDAPSGQSVVSYLVRVYEDPILAKPVGDLESELNEKFPNSFVELDEIADRLIVRGQAPDAIEMSQILQILAGARGVRAGLTRPANPVTVAAAYDFVGAVDALSSEETAAERRRNLDPVALAQAGIINQMKIVGEQQVMLKVTVAEVNRSAARSIGLNFGVDNDNGLTVFQSLTGNLASTQNQSSANILASLDMGQVRLAIEALRRMNLSRTLAEPNLVAMNGQPADFQAGGQFPIPIISSGGTGGNNLQGVSFVPFGVQLQFTPFIQDRDVIRLQMNAEVSTRDESLGTSIGGGGGGTQVSGLNSRNFSTTVQLRSGQTIAVAGLLQTNYGASTDRVPFWGDLPIIGATGGVNRSSSGEQELVILVTPHLVAPVDACSAPALPGSDVHEPTDIEFFIANRLESRRSKDYRSSVRTDYARQKRAEHCCPELFMIGEVGPTDRCCPRPAPVPHTAIRSNEQPIPPATFTESMEPFHITEPNNADGLSLRQMIQRGSHVQ